MEIQNQNYGLLNNTQVSTNLQGKTGQEVVHMRLEQNAEIENNFNESINDIKESERITKSYSALTGLGVNIDFKA